MRHWPLLVLEHVAFEELPVLPFLCPRAFTYCAATPSLSKPRRKSPVVANEPTKTSPSCIQPSKSKTDPSPTLTRKATSRSCPFAGLRDPLTSSNSIYYRTVRHYSQRAADVETFSQDAASHISPAHVQTSRLRKAPVSQKTRPIAAKLAVQEHPEDDLHKDEHPTTSLDGHLKRRSRYHEPSMARGSGEGSTSPSAPKVTARVAANPRFTQYLKSNRVKPRTKQPSIQQNDVGSKLFKSREINAASSIPTEPRMHRVHRRWPFKASSQILREEYGLHRNDADSTRYQSPSNEPFSRTWRKTIAYMKATNDTRLHPSVLRKANARSFPSQSNPEFTSAIANELFKEFPNPTQEDRESLSFHWEQLSLEARLSQWPIIALEYLRRSSEAALEFINATKLNPMPPSYQIVDVLDVAAEDIAKKHDAKSYASLFRATQVVLENHEGIPNLSQKSIKLLLDCRGLQSIKAITIHNLLLHYDVQQNFQTKLQFANALAKEQEHEAASKMFFDAVNSGADIRSVGVKKSAAKLLNELSSHDSYEAATKLIADFLAVNIELDITMYNILIMKAFESNDPDTAWKIYDLMRHNGMNPDDFTYCIVLRGCRAHQNIGKCEEIIMEIESLHDHIPTDFLLVEMLWDVYFFRERNHNFDEHFNRVLRIYENHYDTLPLEKLGLVAGKTYSSDERSSRRVPSSRILEVMLFAYLRTATKGMCAAVYNKFRQEVEILRNPELVPLAAESFTYHSFMKRLADIKSPLWKKVFTDMSADLPNTVNKDTGKQFKPPGPTLQALNIVLHSYAKEANHTAVGRILQLMERHDLKPDSVTYTSIVDMYARQQDVRMVAECLKLMEDQGVAANQITLRSIQRINDRPGLIDALRAVQEVVKELEPVAM